MKQLICSMLGISLLLTGCNSNKSNQNTATSLSQYFSVPTLVSKKSSLSVQLKSGALFEENADASIFKISPSIAGTWVKVSEIEFLFAPSQPLVSGKTYQITVDNKNIRNVPNAPSSIDLYIGVIKQDVELVPAPLRNDEAFDVPALILEVTVNTADALTLEEIKSSITVSGTKNELVWRAESSTRFKFIISGIIRGENATELTLLCKGKNLDIEKDVTETIRIPSIKEFEILSVQVSPDQSDKVSIFFSDPLAANQELDGLIQLEKETNPRFVINGNEVSMYLSQKPSGTRTLTIFPGIKNKPGYALENKIERSVSFEQIKPELKRVGSGSIVPSTKGLYFPFEAVGLQSVQVKITRIHAQNLPLFFQSNNWSGDNETVRTGKVAFAGKVMLKKENASLADWNRHHLDLSSLFEAEKGALYRVEIGMRPNDALNNCLSGTVEEINVSAPQKDWGIYEQDGFDYYSSYDSWYYPEGYRWSERENPCHISYFNNDRSITSNLLATDIGLIAKIGTDNQLYIYTTSLTAGAPIVAEIEVLDFQLQQMNTGKTNSDGFLSVTPERRPFLIVATVDGQKSYLKLNDGLALSTSNFDVSGQQVRKGVKGFIYGERDVWRPGDAIYLSFMLEDEKKSLPENYPVRLQLRDPNGNIKDEQINATGLNGLYVFKTKTQSNDLTGNWLATVSAGNSQFSKRIKIETVKPNRLKINLTFAQETYYKSDGVIPGKISASWLTGLQAPSLTTQIELSYRPVPTLFDGYAPFTFDMPGMEFSEEKTMIVNSATNVSGELTFEASVPSSIKPPGQLRLKFDAKVYEPGGGFSTYTESVNYMPYASFAGVKVPEGDEFGYLKRNAQHQFEFVAVTDKGKSVNKQLNVQIFKLGWRWWWDQQYDHEASYVISDEKSPVYASKVTVENGKASLKIDGKNLDWGRHMVVVTDPISGHKAGKIFYMGWSEGEKSGIGASFLSVTTPKNEYKSNETVTVTLPASIEGKALITIENGSSVMDQFWINTQNATSQFTFVAKPDMAPNIYLNVTLLQPHGATKNDLPIRSYGILPLKIYSPETILAPEIQMADALAPGKEVAITLREKNGNPMTYTLAVVDEGLLDITGFKTPDPWLHFYQKEALGVKTWDIYDHVLGAFGGKLERLLAIGGSDELDPNSGSKRENRFESVVQFMGPFELKSKESKTHTFQMPQYIGAVKVMVVAGNDAKYGKADKSVSVTQPLMVLGTLPRVMSPGETLQLPVNIMRLKSSLTSASVSIKTEGVITVLGAGKKEINLTGDYTTDYFTVSADNKTGKGKVTIIATNGNEKAEHVINIESRMPNPMVTQNQSLRLPAGESITAQLKSIGITGTNSRKLTFSKLPEFGLEKHLSSLIRYPHGCLEQVTSAVFPQLYLSDLMNLPLERKIEVEQNIKSAILRLQQFQNHEGALAYWPGTSDVNQWAGIYATHFLVEAQKKGFFVPSDFLKKLLSYQKKQSTSWRKNDTRYNEDLVQGYRLYMLAQAGEADQSAMNRLRNEKLLSIQARERLAAAYAEIGRKEIALDILKSNVGVKETNYDYWYTYGSEERDMAMRLETFTSLQENEKAFDLVQRLAAKMSLNEFMNTQATAYCLMAISQFAATQKQAESMKILVDYQDKSAVWESTLSVHSGSLMIANESEALKVTNQGQGDLFVTITQAGIPLPGAEKASEKDLSITVLYRDAAGNSLDIDNLPIGENFEIQATVKNTTTSTIRNIALSHLIPSGWEINNSRITSEENSKESGDFSDVRDDRVYNYFNLLPGKTRTFTIRATAAYAGKYYLPAVHAEAMYDASQFARTEGKWIQVNQLK